MLKSFGKMLKGGKKGSPNAEFDDLESVLKSTQGYRKRSRGQRDESKGGKLEFIAIYAHYATWWQLSIYPSPYSQLFNSPTYFWK